MDMNPLMNFDARKGDILKDLQMDINARWRDFINSSQMYHEARWRDFINRHLEERFGEPWTFFCVKSSDNVVFEMNKSAATTQSVVLRDLLKTIPSAGDDGDEIPLLQVSSLVLPKIISFCKKKHKFDTIIETTVGHLKTTVDQLKTTMEHLKGTVDAYKAWVTGFVKTNKPLFTHLHQAADYLDIPTLFELTSEALGDMRENSVEEVSEWYAGLSIPRMLSPLGIQAYSLLTHLDFFS